MGLSRVRFRVRVGLVREERGKEERSRIKKKHGRDYIDDNCHT